MSAITRILRLRQSSRIIEVPVDIGPPMLTDGTWTCPFRVGWPDGPKIGDASGFDSTQALYHAMQLVAAQLYMSEAHQRGDLYWDRPGNGYGYPLPFGGRKIAIGDDKKL
jgi:hypothetical protein